MSILQFSENFGSLKIKRFAIQRWYHTSAAAAVRNRFAVRHSEHALCKRFLGTVYALEFFFQFSVSA